MNELQDQAGKFLSEMRSKLLSHEQYRDQIPCDTTGRSYPFREHWNDGIVEVSIVVPCADLNCMDSRFIKESGVDFSLDGKTITLTLKKNAFGRSVDSPQYRSTKKALNSFEQRRERLEQSVDTLPYRQAKRLGLR